MYQTKGFTRNFVKRCAILMLILSVLFTLSPAAYAKEDLTKKILDVVVVGNDPRCQIALLADGTVRTTGLAYAGYSKNLIRWVSSWTDIVQICTMELDPKYATVIVERFHLDYPDQEITVLRNGEAMSYDSIVKDA